MTDPLPDVFGVPLGPDPAVAIPHLKINLPAKIGPMHKVQFVIEYVGPRSMPAGAVATLLTPEWFNALGRPQLFVMRPSDLNWQYLTPSPDGSYDSLALAWDLITPQGNITSASALQLMQFADRFGPHVGRRTMPLPHPGEVNQTVAKLLQARDQLDIGMVLTVIGSFEERALWIECSKLGLQFSPQGSFDWPGTEPDLPLVSVSPAAEGVSFSLGAVQADKRHDAIAIGFSIPLCAAPVQALETAFRIGGHLAAGFGGRILDPDDAPLTDRSRQELRDNLRQALGMYSQLGITTGSPEAVKLFLA